MVENYEVGIERIELHTQVYLTIFLGGLMNLFQIFRMEKTFKAQDKCPPHMLPRFYILKAKLGILQT